MRTFIVVEMTPAEYYGLPHWLKVRLSRRWTKKIKDNAALADIQPKLKITKN